MLLHWQWNWQRANRAEVPLRPLVPLTVQLLVLQLCRPLLTSLLVMLAMNLLAVDATVLDEAAGRAVLEFDGVALVLAAVRAQVNVPVGNAAHAPQRRRPEESSGWLGTGGRSAVLGDSWGRSRR